MSDGAFCHYCKKSVCECDLPFCRFGCGNKVVVIKGIPRLSCERCREKAVRFETERSYPGFTATSTGGAASDSSDAHSPEKGICNECGELHRIGATCPNPTRSQLAERYLSTRNKQLEAALREAREDLSKIRDEAILNDHYYIDQLLAKAISKIDQLLSASERADGKQ